MVQDNVIKVAYYISQYGYSKLCNTTIKRVAFDQIAGLLNVKPTTFNLLVAKCMSLTSEKYPSLSQASIEPSIKSIVESYSKIPEDKIFSEIQLILNLKFKQDGISILFKFLKHLCKFKLIP